MTKKLTIKTTANEKVLEALLREYDVHAKRDEFGYINLIYPSNRFKDIFLKTMRELLSKRIYVTVLDITISQRVYKETAYRFADGSWLTEQQGESQPYNNWVHRQYSEIDELNYI